MDHMVNRESIAMKAFAAQTQEIADSMEDVCSHLRQLLQDANDYMQDESGQEALSIVEELIEDTSKTTVQMRTLANQVKRSADLLEESDTLL